jgi:hypothetical protein
MFLDDEDEEEDPLSTLLNEGGIAGRAEPLACAPIPLSALLRDTGGGGREDRREGADEAPDSSRFSFLLRWSEEEVSFALDLGVFDAPDGRNGVEEVDEGALDEALSWAADDQRL